MGRILIFAKAPRLGLVKTRLANVLGAAEACRIYVELLQRTFAAFRETDSVEVRYTPDDAAPDLKHFGLGHWNYRPQGHGDLGARLLRAFEENREFKSIIAIGTDCPTVESSDFDAAFAALERADVVVGPGVDGGYWLIGMRRPHPMLFAEIEWSSPKVFAQTLTAAKEAGLAVEVLRTLRDIDTVEDWRAWRRKATQSDE